jgi:hypothetical protein
MPRISDEAREHNEAAIRAAMDRLLRGEIPPGGRCDLKTLAAEAGVTRTGFYPKKDRPGPYQHLAEEFERRLAHLRDAGQIPDPRDAQIARLKEQSKAQRGRLTTQDAEIAELTAFKQKAISRLAAQNEQIEQLRRLVHERPDNVRALPRRAGAPTEPR